MPSSLLYSLQEIAAKEHGEVLSMLSVNTDTGLSAAEATRRLKQYGPNTIREKERMSELLLLLQHFKNPLVIILLIAAIISSSMGEAVNAAIISVIIILSISMDYWQEKGARKAVEMLRKSVTWKVLVLRDGSLLEMEPEALCPGDIIALSAGKIVPADARVFFAKDLLVNQSSLTGESFPAEKNSDAIKNPSDDIAAMSNIIYMGSSIISGSAEAVVVNTGAHTAFGKIAEKLRQRSEISDFSRGMQKFGYLVMKITMILILFIFLINIVLKHNLLDAFMFSIAIAVGLTPELLPVIMSVTMSRGAMRIASKGVIVKNIAAIPNFGSMEILCTDKTGTITEDKIRLVKCISTNGEDIYTLFQLTYLNSFFQSGIKNPLDNAVMAFNVPDISCFRKVDEIPFDFYRKRASVVVEHNGKHLLICKGAPEEIWKVCVGKDGLASNDHQVYNGLSQEGFRVLAVATREFIPKCCYTKEDEQLLQFRGFVTFMDPAKEDAAEVISALAQMGVEIKIITGDNHMVTEKICKDIGLPVKGIMLGTEMAAIPDDALQRKASETTIFARFSPDQKNRVIHALKAYHRSVGYMGDGINDALSLRTADIGITVDSATDVAKDAADIILTQKHLLVLKEGILEGRKTFGNTMKYILMDLSSNFGNMFSVAAATLLLPFLPMLPVQILLNNFLYDTSQLAIPADHVDSSYVLKPKRWNIQMIRNFMFAYGILSSLFDLVAFYLLYNFFRVSQPQFRTGWFMESLATQILVVFIIRTNRLPFIQSKPSRLLLISTFVCLAAGWCLPYTPFAGVLGFSPLPLHIVGYITGLVVIYLCCAELLKRFIHRHTLKE